MGETGRRVLHERTTPGQRFDIGLQMLDETVEARIARMDIPQELTGQARKRFIVQQIISEER